MKSVGSVAQKLKEADVKREVRRLKQIEESALRAKERGKGKKKMDEDAEQNMDVAVEEVDRPHGQKRKAMEDSALNSRADTPQNEVPASGVPAKKAKPDGPALVTLEMVCCIFFHVNSISPVMIV